MPLYLAVTRVTFCELKECTCGRYVASRSIVNGAVLHWLSPNLHLQARIQDLHVAFDMAKQNPKTTHLYVTEKILKEMMQHEDNLRLVLAPFLFSTRYTDPPADPLTALCYPIITPNHSAPCPVNSLVFGKAEVAKKIVANRRTLVTRYR